MRERETIRGRAIECLSKFERENHMERASARISECASVRQMERASARISECASVRQPQTHRHTSLPQQELETLQASIMTLTGNNAKQEKQHAEQIATLLHASILRAHLLPELDRTVNMLRLCAADVKEQWALAHVIIATHQQAEEDIIATRHETVTLTNAHASEMQTLRAQLTTTKAALLENIAATAHAAAAASAMAQSCDRFKAGVQRLQETQINARVYAQGTGVLASGLGAWLTGTTVEKSLSLSLSLARSLARALSLSLSQLWQSQRCTIVVPRREEKEDDDKEKEEEIICH
jgi:hypothetical protein